MLLSYNRFAPRLFTRTIKKNIINLDWRFWSKEQRSNVNKAVHVQQCSAAAKFKTFWQNNNQGITRKSQKVSRRVMKPENVRKHEESSTRVMKHHETSWSIRKCQEATIYGFSRTIVAPSLYIWPEQITQSYGGDCPGNTMDWLTVQILLTKTQNRRFLANPTDKYASQWSSLPPAWSSTGMHICHLNLLGIADYNFFVSRICNVCASLGSCITLLVMVCLVYIRVLSGLNSAF